MNLVRFLVAKRKLNFEIQKNKSYICPDVIHSTLYHGQHTGTVMQFVNTIIQFSCPVSPKIECKHEKTKRLAQMLDTPKMEKVERKLMIFTFLDLCMQLI